MATRGRYLFLLGPSPQPWLNSPSLSPSFLCLGHLLIYLQALRLLRLANKLEGKVVALKKKALQHITIVLVGSDTSGLFQLLTMFFGTGEADEDPFNFLDGAPLIKQPLPLTSESSDDEEVPASQPTTSQPSASTSASRISRVKKNKLLKIFVMSTRLSLCCLWRNLSMKLVFRMICCLPGIRCTAQQREVASISANIQGVITALTPVTSLAMGATFVGCT